MYSCKVLIQEPSQRRRLHLRPRKHHRSRSSNGQNTVLDSRPSHETEMRPETPCRRWRLACARDKSAVPRRHDVGMDVDDGSFGDACWERCVCKVIDRLNGSEGFGEYRDAVQTNVVGIGDRQYARSVVVRFAYSDELG